MNRVSVTESAVVALPKQAIPQQHTEDLAVLLLGGTGWDMCMISCLASGQSSSKNKWRPVTPSNSLLGRKQQQSKRIVPGSSTELLGKIV